MPLHPGGWGESLETHPRSMRRLADIANTHGVSAERLQSLIADTPAAAESKYPLIEQPETETRLFSSDFKRKYRVRLVLTLFGVLAVTPVPFAWLLDRLGSPLWLAITAVAGQIVSFGLYQVVRNRLIYVGQRSFSNQLRSGLEKRGLTEIANRLFLKSRVRP